MTPTRNGTRRYPADILPREQAEVGAAKVAARVVELAAEGLADPEHGREHLSDAARLAQILDGLTGYVQMLEKRNP